MKPKTTERHVGIEIECMLTKPYSVNSIRQEIRKRQLDKYVDIGTDMSVQGNEKVTKEFLQKYNNARVADYDFGTTTRLLEQYPNLARISKFDILGKPTHVQLKGFEFRILVSVSEYAKIVPKVLDMILDMGGKVNATCGLHVHLDMRHEKDVLGSLQRLLYAQNSFMPTLAKSRLRNSYCRKVGTSLKEVSNYLLLADKYTAVNMRTLRTLGTIEVRAHEGTLHADTIVSWINYLWSVVDSRRSSNRLERYVKIKAKKN